LNVRKAVRARARRLFNIDNSRSLKVATDPNTTSRPLVSVIIPTYNYGALIGETLTSLQRQTLTDWECIVIDDGSTDDTAEVLARFAESDPRIRYLLQENQRQAVAKNTGLAHAKGKYVQFLDADDLVEPRKLERQVAYLEEHPEVDIVYGSVRYFRTNNPNERLYSMGGDNLPGLPQVSGGDMEVLKALVRANIMVINSPLIRRSIAELVGPFDVRLPPAEDWDYWLRCALAAARFQFVDIQDTLALVRMHPTSSSQNRLRMHRAGLLIRKKLAAMIKDEEVLAINRELRAGDEAEFGIMEADRKRSFNAAWHLGNSAWFERRWRWKTKLFACALMAPLISGTRLRSLIASSLTASVRDLGRKRTV
jgi:glycosyltransferase involved in cell wall biosynthesis